MGQVLVENDNAHYSRRRAQLQNIIVKYGAISDTDCQYLGYKQFSKHRDICIILA
jgi:hypothetical protein